MYDYSLHAVASLPAKVGDKLITTKYSNTPTRGFSPIGEPRLAVCLVPGTEVAFEEQVEREPTDSFSAFSSVTARRSFTRWLGSDSSTRTNRPHIMMRLNFPMAKSCC